MAENKEEPIEWSDELHEKSDGTDPLEITTEKVERGYWFDVHSASICDQTTTNKLLELGVKYGDAYFPQVKRVAGTNNYTMTTPPTNFHVRQGGQIYAKVHSPTDKDICNLNFCGYLKRQK